jgi:hypothetical protein
MNVKEKKMNQEVIIEVVTVGEVIVIMAMTNIGIINIMMDITDIIVSEL